MSDDLMGCKHPRKQLLCGRDGSDERTSVQVCRDCGEIIVWSRKNGVMFDISFTINSYDTLKMIAKWTRYVNQD